MATLSSMPGEIIVNIARFMRTEDLASLRLANRKTERAIFTPFAREFFVKKQFMLTEPSLQALIEISEHPQFGPELRHLIIGLDHYDKYSPPLGALSEEQETEYLAGMHAQEALVHSGAARDMLALAMQKLPALETVDIRDFRSSTRRRDHGAWASLGAATIRQCIGRDIAIAPTHHAILGPSQAFALTVAALAQAGRTGVGIETVLRSVNSGLTDSAFALSSFSTAQTQPVLQSMKKLHLCMIATAPTSPRNFTTREASGTDAKGVLHRWMHSSQLQTFLSKTTGLTWLRLNFSQLRSPPGAWVSLLNWIALPPSVPTPVRFTAPLERLDLGKVFLRPADCLPVILRFRDTLRCLSLWDFGLDLLQQQRADKENVVTPFLKKLAAGLPHLSELVIGRLQLRAMGQGSGVFNVNFDVPADPLLAQGRRVGTITDSLTYRGDRAADYLNAMADHLVIRWPIDVVPDVDMADSDSEFVDDDENDDDDDDEDDEDNDHIAQMAAVIASAQAGVSDDD